MKVQPLTLSTLLLQAVKLIVREGASLEDIKAILCNPSIYDTITSDGCEDFSDFQVIIDSCFLIGGYVDNKIVALACYYPFRDGLKYHPNVLPRYRAKYASKFVEQSLKRTQPIYVEIPEIYKHVISFAKKYGFKLVEINKDAHKKNNSVCDTNIMRL